MPLRTQVFSMLPWAGGLNSSVDESVIPPNQLTVADNVIFGTRASRKKREGCNHDWDDAANDTDSIIGLKDFWYGASTRTQRIVGVADDKAVYAYNSSGGRTTLALDAGATAWASSISNCSMEVLNQYCIIAVDGSGNVLRKWAGGATDLFDLAGTPPQASIVRQHLGRLWTNDKTNLDRVHYSTTANPEEWLGLGDSGAVDLPQGDGDPDGITALWSFKNQLYIAKRTKLYRLIGQPDEGLLELVSAGIGCISHNSVCVTDNDVYFVSERGIHSLAATDKFGDVESAFVSADIQRTFDEDFNRSRLKFTWGAYLDRINSVAFTFTEDNDTTNQSVYLYNTAQQAWYRWPALSCQSLIVANDADKKRFYLGTNVTRVTKTFHGTNYDVSTSGGNVPITFRVATGYIFPDGNPYAVKGFKKFSLVYKPEGTHTITATAKIDNFAAGVENTITFSEISSSALLGTTFVLGVSQLGYEVVMQPYTRSLDGYGHGVKITIEQSGTDESAEIQGFMIEYEVSGSAQETRLSDGSSN